MQTPRDLNNLKLGYRYRLQVHVGEKKNQVMGVFRGRSVDPDYTLWDVKGGGYRFRALKDDWIVKLEVVNKEA